MNSAPIAIEAKPNTSSTWFVYRPSSTAAIAWKRMIAYIPVFRSAAESNALAGLGASEWASGNHVIGANPTFVPYPITASRNARRRLSRSSNPAWTNSAGHVSRCSGLRGSEVAA